MKEEVEHIVKGSLRVSTVSALLMLMGISNLCWILGYELMDSLLVVVCAGCTIYLLINLLTVGFFTMYMSSPEIFDAIHKIKRKVKKRGTFAGVLMLLLPDIKSYLSFLIRIGKIGLKKV